MEQGPPESGLASLCGPRAPMDPCPVVAYKPRMVAHFGSFGIAVGTLASAGHQMRMVAWRQGGRMAAQLGATTPSQQSDRSIVMSTLEISLVVSVAVLFLLLAMTIKVASSTSRVWCFGWGESRERASRGFERSSRSWT